MKEGLVNWSIDRVEFVVQVQIMNFYYVIFMLIAEFRCEIKLEQNLNFHCFKVN